MKTVPVIALLVAAAAAPAAATTYTDLAAFLAAVPGTSVIEDFETAAPKDVQLGSLSRASGTYFALQGGHAIVVASSGYDNFGAGVSPTVSAVLTANDTENFRGTLGDPTLAYGFDVLLSDFYTTTVVSFFSASSALLGSLSFAADADATNNARFAGITSATPVSYFTFVSTGPNVQNSGIDNIRALPGGAPLPGAVPEPATWALLLGGFAMTGVALRRRTAIAG